MDPMDLIAWLMGRPRPQEQAPLEERIASRERDMGLELAPPEWASSAGPAMSPPAEEAFAGGFREPTPMGPTAGPPQGGPAPYQVAPAPVVPFSVANAAATNPMALDFPSYVNPQAPFQASGFKPRAPEPPEASGEGPSAPAPFEDLQALRERQLLSGQGGPQVPFRPNPNQPVPLPVGTPPPYSGPPTRKSILPFAHSVPALGPTDTLPMIMGGQARPPSQVPAQRPLSAFQAPSPVPSEPRPARPQAASPPPKRSAPPAPQPPAQVQASVQPQIAPEPKPPVLGEAMPEALKQQLLAEAIALSKARRVQAAGAQAGAQTAAGVAR